MKHTEQTPRIPVGTLIKGDKEPGRQIRDLASFGFETFSIMFWQHTGDTDLTRMAEETSQASRRTGTPLSSPCRSTAIPWMTVRPDSVPGRT